VDRGCAQQAGSRTADRNMAALQGTGSVGGRPATGRW
jgi:hypothetical protein